MARWSALIRHVHLPVLLLLLCFVQGLRTTPGPCEVETGQASIIVDIEESRGDQVNQSTVPAELPVVGQPDVDVILTTVFPKGPTLFQLDGKRLQLLQPLDRDADNLSHMVFQLICQVKATKKRRTIPVIVRVSDINDNAPVFQNTPYEAEVPELAPLGTTVFDGIKASDIDSGVNGHCEYFTVPSTNLSDSSLDGYGVFVIPQPHQGIVTVNRTLDYERNKQYFLTVVASDRARDNKQRLSSTTTLTVNVKDEDDLDPSFVYKGCTMYEGACNNPEYTSSVNSGVLSGTLTIHPEKIQAFDMDTLNARIRYSIEAGEPVMWSKYFDIDANSGAVRQLVAVDTSITKKFMLTIKAEEQTEAKRYTLAILYITVKPVDTNPPMVIATSIEGMVDENSPVGTKVVDQNGAPVKLTVVDADLGAEDPVPNYKFELTSSSFAVDEEGYLIVNDENLDRDDPNTGKFYRIQVVAREDNGAASPPLTLTITLLDLNDNAPALPKSMRADVPASLEPSDVYRVLATDLDSGENARISYSIKHVSNNGQTKFTIDSHTGVISTTGRLQSGEQYSITVNAEDSGGLKTQGIVELNVIPGPNTSPPQFSMREYAAPVSEGAAINSTVVTVIAKDPENDPVTYSIMSGNDLRQFSIGATSGIITVIRSLDREVLTRYQLMVRAEDSGKLFSTATVNIKVTDINDNNPKFDQDSYTFSVKEGATNEPVGHVHATDLDEGINAVVSYSLPDDLPFHIHNETGLITTNTRLDYETTKQYMFVVTATDGAIDKRLGTASVTVSVRDIPDEVPTFHTSLYTVHAPENNNNYPLVQVAAEDPDTIPEITYTILKGDLELFSIDRKSGQIRTIRPLDREMFARHEIIVGTEENREENKPGATTMVEVLVDDKNDNEPVFTSLSRPVTIDDSSAIGTLVQTVVATDADATPPNNRVKYKLVGRGKATIYFHVEQDTGIVRVRDDLRKESDSEFTVDIQAYDQGDPVLNSMISLTVYVSHSVTVPPDVRLGFADTVYTEHVSENASNGTLIRVLPLQNKRAHGPDTPLKCKLTEFSHKGVFTVKLTEDRDCAIYLNTSSLDYETLNEYSLEVHLESIEGRINPVASKATIKVHVTDSNDNTPVFVYPEQSTISSAKGKYYAIVTKDMLLGTNVLQIKAKDKDSGDYGKIEYQKRTWPKVVDEYFSLDADTGILSNTKTFETIPKEMPFKFSVTARDNPNSAQDYNTAKTNVVVNLLQKDNQLVLEVANVTPDIMRRKVRSLLTLIEDKTGLIAGVEKLTSRHYKGENGTLETDAKGTDVWLYVLDPATGEILTRESKQVADIISSGLHKSLGARLQSQVSPLRAPLAAESPRRPQLASAPLSSALPAALLAMAALVLVAASVATLYICASWNRYKKHKEHEQQYGTITTMSAPARPNSGYDSGDDDPASRYETQVLNMAVDDADLQLDFGPNNHAFNIHSVQYLSKDNGERSPTLSETATTARASSVNENGAVLNNSHFFDTNSNTNTRNTQTLNRRLQNNSHPLNNALGTLPRTNNSGGLLAATLGRKVNGNSHKKRTTQPIMAYDDIPGLQRASENDNVIFGKRNFNGFSYEQSPVETTTEL